MAAAAKGERRRERPQWPRGGAAIVTTLLATLARSAGLCDRSARALARADVRPRPCHGLWRARRGPRASPHRAPARPPPPARPVGLARGPVPDRLRGPLA